MEYRKEIDGLRAIALIPVILFHAGFSTFSGGFIGVDVFFVISGFLITSIILEDLNSGEFRLVHFYERRARRILPALSLVMFVCLLAAWVFLDPHNYALLSRSMVATSTFSSNVYFYLVSGYFDIASDEAPLLHTWSLAVEEQFYIIVPFFLSFFWYQKNRNLMLVLALACIASFMTSVVLSYYPGNANFYLLFSRAWELLVGVLLAYLPTNTNSGHKVAFSACTLGLGMIVYSVLFYNQQTPYPGFYTLFPVAGAALIIRYGAIVNPVSSLLKLKPIVFIGLISYSLYLWHLPILAFMRLKTIGELQASNVYLAIVISFLMASLSWKFVEKPFRDRQNFSSATIAKASIFSIVFFLCAGLSGYLMDGFASRFEHNELANTAVSSHLREKCHTDAINYLPPNRACRYYGGNITWATLGDSHVAEMSLALAEQLQPSGQGLLHLSYSDCPPVFKLNIRKPGCKQWLQDAVNLLVSENSIRNVLVGFRHVFYLYGSHADDYPELPNRDPRRIMAEDFIGTRQDAEEAYWQSYQAIIDALLKADKRVFILFPVPEVPVDIHVALSPFSIFNSQPLLNPEKSLPMAFYATRNKFILKKLSTLTFDSRLIAVRPTDILCDEEYCRAVLNGETMYFDDDHLSVSGARRVTSLMSNLEN